MPSVAQLPPGPQPAGPLLLWRWATRPTAFLDDCERKYGSVFSLVPVGDTGFDSERSLITQVFTGAAEAGHVGELNSAPHEPGARQRVDAADG